MKVISVKENIAVCEAGGITRDVNIFLIEEPLNVGDYVLVHVGYAIEKIDPHRAQETIFLLEQMQQGG
jgi:hydrogenase expression/formation protein HypC